MNVFERFCRLLEHVLFNPALLWRVISWRCFQDRNHINSAATTINTNSIGLPWSSPQILDGYLRFNMPFRFNSKWKLSFTLFNVISFSYFFTDQTSTSHFTLIPLSDNLIKYLQILQYPLALAADPAPWITIGRSPYDSV
jgi:hypothetical protein